MAKTSGVKRTTWRLPLYALLAFLLSSIALPRDLALIFYLVLIVPTISVILLNDAIALKRYRQLIALVLFWATSAILVASLTLIATEIRWLVRSHHYKSELLSQTIPANGYLRHIEWDSWGMFAQNTIVYLIYDPSDTLLKFATSNHPGKLNGIPCEVDRVRRLGQCWFTVQFYTGDDWNHCN